MGFLLATLLVVGLGSQVACGGSPSAKAAAVTPFGKYTVTVNATSGSVSHTTKVTLTVQ
jgi:hypothetical protein